jgi:hypothetical protein
VRFLSAAGEKSAILSLITARRSLFSVARVATGVNQSFSIEASFEEIRAELVSLLLFRVQSLNLFLEIHEGFLLQSNGFALK